MRRRLGLRLVLVALRNGAIAAALSDNASSLVPAFVGCQACRRRTAPFGPTQIQRRRQRTPATWMVRDNGDGSESGASTTDSLFEIGSVDDLPEDARQELEEGQPSEWMVMKDLLGINVFTYVLAAAIAFFLGMNVLLGPGWLGSSIGIQGTGEFTETSSSLPDTLDLGSSKDYLL